MVKSFPEFEDWVLDTYGTLNITEAGEEVTIDHIVDALGAYELLKKYHEWLIPQFSQT